MATITQHAPGTFCWPELATTDQNGAKKFYTTLLGWEFSDSDMGGGEVYTMLQLGGRALGALYTMRKEERSTGVPTHWNSYVSVESADTSAAKAKSLGGTLLAEPFDVMDVGRMAIIQDPAGAVFCLWEAKKHTGAAVLGEVGALCWTELMTGDLKKAEAFYTGLFGWKTEPMPGPMQYTLFKRGADSAGGAMQITPEMGKMPSHWLVYFAVSDCDAIAAKTTALGGKIMRPPADIPNIGRFAILVDPQGGAFAVIKLEQMG
ncbi:MAG TPA: VOC family protein [Candidatus Eisenbacteria bacterium]|nr:VOC family protein [Candidatus Eisenbacteria bacterium]